MHIIYNIYTYTYIYLLLLLVVVLVLEGEDHGLGHIRLARLLAPVVYCGCRMFYMKCCNMIDDVVMYMKNKRETQCNPHME